MAGTYGGDGRGGRQGRTAPVGANADGSKVHHRSDHRAMVVRVWGRWGLKRYVRKRETLPVQPPAAGKRSEGEEMFTELGAAIEKSPKREWEENSWIRPGTWATVDKRGVKKNAGVLRRQEGRKLTRKIHKLLREDGVERARRAGEKATLLWAKGKEKEVWAVVKGWYRQVSEKPAKPCCQTMARQTKEREDLYARQEPPGDPIPCNASRPPLADGAPPDAELRVAVKNLRNGRTGGGSNMQTEDIKSWLRGMERDEKAANEGEEGAHVGHRGDPAADAAVSGGVDPERGQRLPRHRPAGAGVEGLEGSFGRAHEGHCTS